MSQDSELSQSRAPKEPSGQEKALAAVKAIRAITKKDNEYILQILGIIIDVLQEKKINWRLCGSANLKIQGVEVHVGDVDITTDSEGLEIFRDVLEQYITEDYYDERIAANSIKCAMGYYKLEINAYSDEKYSMLDKAVLIDRQGLTFPVLPLDKAVRFYEFIRRTEKVNLIQKHLIIEKTAEHVRNIMEGESSGHDWWHVWRVWKMAGNIGKKEAADLFVIELAALLHDLDDYKLKTNPSHSDLNNAKVWLKEIEAPENVQTHVFEIINDLSFKGSGVKTEMRTIEGKIVQDADRLDAVGAIGIARAFAYGGAKDREMYNPKSKPVMHQTFEEYKNSHGTTINHFYEKLLLLRGLMNTETAKSIAEERHEYMENFLERFYKEWEGA